MDFILPKKRPEDKQLVVFYLSPPKGYVDIMPYFCIETETGADLTDDSMGIRHTAPPHSLKGGAATPALADCAPNPTYNKQWARNPPPPPPNSKRTPWTR